MARLTVQGLVVVMTACFLALVGGRHLEQLPGVPLPEGFIPPPPSCKRQGPFPYMVSLRDEVNQHFCGGVLISDRTVATAASCLGRAASSISIAIGGFSVLAPVEVRRARSVHKHPLWKYDPRKGFNIGVVILDFPTCGKPIPNLGGPQSTGQENIFLGFGRSSTDGPFSNDLLVGEFTTQSPTACLRSYQHGNAWISSNAVCTKGPGGNGGICEGDEGGPLIYRPTVTEFKDRLVGIASFVTGGSGGCSDPNTFGVFTDINHFDTWLRNFV